MSLLNFKRVPKHIGIIPDGNRRWAVDKGLGKHEGYSNGIVPGFELYDMCKNAGIEEITFYGFTQDNTKRPSVQKEAFKKACVDAVLELSKNDAEVLVVGNTESKQFPEELKKFTKRNVFGKGGIKINFLVNYSWNWDLNLSRNIKVLIKNKRSKKIASCDISRIDLIIRWGGRRRLSGFLPIQTIYSDFFVIDDMWPDFKREHLYQALSWYQIQDVTLGG